MDGDSSAVRATADTDGSDPIITPADNSLQPAITQEEVARDGIPSPIIEATMDTFDEPDTTVAAEKEVNEEEEERVANSAWALLHTPKRSRRRAAVLYEPPQTIDIGDPIALASSALAPDPSSLTAPISTDDVNVIDHHKTDEELHKGSVSPARSDKDAVHGRRDLEGEQGTEEKEEELSLNANMAEDGSAAMSGEPSPPPEDGEGSGPDEEEEEGGVAGEKAPTTNQRKRRRLVQFSYPTARPRRRQKTLPSSPTGASSPTGVDSSSTASSPTGKPVLNMAGVNIAGLLAESSDPPPFFSRRLRRTRRRVSLLEDNPIFSQHRDLRANALDQFFHSAPLSTDEDVLRSINTWTDSPSLVYAELLWTYAPDAALALMMMSTSNNAER